MIFKMLLLLPLAYLLGSIPWGVIFTRLFSDVDVRSEGSRNIGANNVFRLAGTKLGLLTLTGDLLKGAIPTLAATCWLDAFGWIQEVLVSLVALSAFAGHLFPIFLRFSGGKGVATASGCFLIISPLAFLVSLLVYVLVLCLSGYSSVGSLSAAAVLPGALWLATPSVPFMTCALIMAIAIYVRHAENVKQLFKGTESSPFRGDR
jgi:glycerol-3-phosphate acyltransferase PlsY